MNQASEDENALPAGRVREHRRVSWLWLMPLLALLLVGYLIYQFVSERGPLISITFETADGLSERQTEVKYRAVSLGIVEQIQLSEDRKHVVVEVRMNESAKPLLNEHTRFWVVRPRLDGGLNALSAGLQTLVSGAYIAVDPGVGGGKDKSEFEGLQTPPSVRSGDPGTVYFLRAKQLGGLSRGAPIYYRDVEVGEMLSYELKDEAVRLRVFIKAPYDQNVVRGTRFWNSSGLTIAAGADGLNVRLQSAKTLLSGGIAFRSPARSGEGAVDKKSPAESTFELLSSEAVAEMGFYEQGHMYVSYFNGSVDGLVEGAPVLMLGRKIGAVTHTSLRRDPRPQEQQQFAARVEFVLQPKRALTDAESSALAHDHVVEAVAAGLRVVLKTNSFLTGQKVLSLEYFPTKEEAGVTREGEAMVLPGRSQDIQDVAQSAASVVEQIEQIPFAEIGENLNRSLAAVESTVAGPQLKRAIAELQSTLEQAHELMREARAGLRPAFERIPKIAEKLEGAASQAEVAMGQSGYGANSTVHRNLERLTDQVAEAARSIRLLADQLNRHPEALIRGRTEETP